MTLYIGLVTYNSITDLPRCLHNLRAQALSDICLLAWDNNSTDGSADWLRANAPDVRLITYSENIGYGKAHNALIQASNLQPGDFYMALNPDADLAPNYTALLVEAIRARPGMEWATGKLLMKDDQHHPTGQIYSAGHGMLNTGFAFNIGYGILDDARFSMSREVFGAPGAAVVYSASLISLLIERDGYFFDPAMFMYAEDTDVDWRARRYGLHCWYVAEAVAYHRGSRPKPWLMMTAVSNRYISVLKNAPVPQLFTVNLPYIVIHCLLRLLLTPRLGVRLLGNLLRHAPNALRQRSASEVDGSEIKAWFLWSAQQPTEQRSQFDMLLHK
jgi:GT2 family glycosyltransferase